MSSVCSGGQKEINSIRLRDRVIEFLDAHLKELGRYGDFPSMAATVALEARARRRAAFAYFSVPGGSEIPQASASIRVKRSFLLVTPVT